MQITQKPWGKEEILELNDKYMLKRLTMNKNCRCSLQYHNKKCETIYVLEGNLKITVNDVEKIYSCGENITIKPSIVHRMEAITNCVYLEASTPETDDTVRISDDYKRN